MIEQPTILFGDRDQYVEKPLDAVLRVYPDFVARCPCLGTAGSDVDCNNTSFKIGLERLCVPIALNAIYQGGSGSKGDGFLHGALVTQSGDLRLAEA